MKVLFARKRYRFAFLLFISLFAVFVFQSAPLIVQTFHSKKNRNIIPASLPQAPLNSSLQASTGFSSIPDWLKDQNNRWIDKEVMEGEVPSIAVGVLHNDELVYTHGNKANEHTPFSIASLTKVFTSLIIMQLEEEGLLHRTDSVSSILHNVHLENSRLQSKPITVQHLMDHSSGIASYGPYRNVRWKKYSQQVPVQVVPVEKAYFYSNESYVLLGWIIEQATGESLATNFKKRILSPLNMNESYVSDANGTSGIVSTISDLAKFATLLIHKGKVNNHTFISEESFQQMLGSPPAELPDESVSFYTRAGWDVVTKNGEVIDYFKAGRWFGAASGLRVYPVKNTAYLFLCNPPAHRTLAFLAFRDRLMAQLRMVSQYASGDKQLGMAWPGRPSVDLLKKVSGVYVNQLTNEKIKISVAGQTLIRTRYNTHTPLLRQSGGIFFVNNLMDSVQFSFHNSVVEGVSLRDGFFKKEIQ